MRGHLFVTLGDITRLTADAVAYSTDRALSPGGQLTAAFDRNIEGFRAAYAALGEAERPNRPQPGTAYWLPRAKDAKGPRPHGVVVTIAVGRGAPREVRAHDAVHAALACAAKHLASVPKPWLVALPTFLTGDGGARHDRLAVAEPQIEAAEEFLDAHDDVDVAFVAYTEATYQVWLEARRRVHAARAVTFPSTLEPDAALVEAVRNGECVLFVGSGVSTDAGLPSWSDLVAELGDELGVPKDARGGDLDYFLDLAQWYRDARRDPPLEDRVAARFTAENSGARPTLAHYLLASIPARYYVTTNYDDLLESALAALRRWPIRVVREQDVASTGSSAGCYVVKFHGCAVTREAVVLSRDDYDDFFRRRPAMALLLEGLLLNQSFFYVGYGLRDPDFRQIHTRVAFMLRDAKRPAFATTFEATTDHPRKQWRTKHLELVDIPGDDTRGKSRNLARFLDRLGEQVARDPHLFLAEDVDHPLSPEGGVVRDQLLALVGPLLSACARAEQTNASEVRALAEVLRFLCARGFRGHSPGQLASVFERLAWHRELSISERRDLLVSALRHTENQRDAERMLLALRTLDPRS